jgi:hypothetical protein
MPSCSVQRKAILRVSPGSSSVMIGPCRVVTTSNVTSGLPLTWIVSCRCCASTHPAGVLYWPCALNSSMKSSSTVGPTLVNPQPMRWLWPTITNGTPGSVTPATSKSRFPLSSYLCASYLRRVRLQMRLKPQGSASGGRGAYRSTAAACPKPYAARKPPSCSTPAGTSRIHPPGRYGEGHGFSRAAESLKKRWGAENESLEGSAGQANDGAGAPHERRSAPPSGSTSSSSSSSSSPLWIAGSSSIRRVSVGGRSRQEEFTYRSAVNSGPSLARIFSRQRRP